MRKIKFAVVGFGHIGKRHAEMINRNPEAELVAIVDKLSADQLSGNTYDVPLFSDIKNLLNGNLEIDVINIATPNGFHVTHSLIALDAFKHVVIEKPMALTKNDAEKVIYKALQVHRHVFTVMQNRYSPPSAWLKNVIDSKILGKVYMVQLNCFWNRDERYYYKGSWHGSKRARWRHLIYTVFSFYRYSILVVWRYR